MGAKGLSKMGYFFFQERRDSLGFSVYYVDIFQLDNFFVQQQEQETAKFS